MKKLGTYLLYGGALFFAIALVFISMNPEEKAESNNAETRPQAISPETAKNEQVKPAEKVQVYVFHSTNRCFSCVTIGKFSKKTIEQKFPDELSSGKIEFKEINIDLPENRTLTNKFEATGSALFINAVIDGEDNIKQNTQVWRLVSDEQKFINYLSGEIKKLL